MKTNKPSAETREALLAWQDKIATDVKSLGQQCKQLAEASQQRDALAVEIAALERAEDTAAAAVNALRTKTDQFALLTKKTNRLSAEASPNMEQLRGTLRFAGQDIRRALNVDYEELANTISKQLTRFFSDPTTAYCQAKQTDHCAAFGSYMSRTFGIRMDALSEAREVRALIGEILSGELAWNFEPREN